MPVILIVEDEPHIATGLRFNLEAEGHTVLVAETGEDALTIVAAQAAQPGGLDAVILDVMLPGLDGFAVSTALRARGWFKPILMLTALGRPEDVLKGFEAGADDYLSKPFDLSILIARMHALLRRHAWHAPPLEPVDADRYRFSGKTVDFDRQEIEVGDERFPLTLMEVNLLRYLIRHEGQAVSRKRILEDVWNVREDTDTRAIDHFIARLRKYIETEPGRPKHVQTVRGVGYRFVAEPERT